MIHTHMGGSVSLTSYASSLSCLHLSETNSWMSCARVEVVVLSLSRRIVCTIRTRSSYTKKRWSWSRRSISWKSCKHTKFRPTKVKTICCTLRTFIRYLSRKSSRKKQPTSKSANISRANWKTNGSRTIKSLRTFRVLASRLIKLLLLTSLLSMLNGIKYARN